MEESSNGKREETLKAEAHDEEKEVVLEDSAALKPDAEFVRDIVADSNSMSVNETPVGDDSSSSGSSSEKEPEPEERSHHVENPETFEEEKVVSDSGIESVEFEPGVSLTQKFNQDIEPSVERSGDSEVAELDAKELEKNISPSLDETGADSPMLTGILRNGLKKETEQLSSAETARDPGLSADVESKGIDKETTLPDLDETDGSTFAPAVLSRGIEETTVSCLVDNAEVPAAAVAQGITETKIPASDNNAGSSSGSPQLEHEENVEDLLQAENTPMVESSDTGELVKKPDIQESTGNQSIMNSVRSTSWKSCCGLFEVLRRSER